MSQIPKFSNHQWSMRHLLSAPILLGLIVIVLFPQSIFAAETIEMKDGRIYTGRVGQIGSLSEGTVGPSAILPRITLIDDKLRRTYVGLNFIRKAFPGAASGKTEIIKINQKVCLTGNLLKSVSFPLRVTPFDQFGRRVYTIQISNIKGRNYDVIQGITEITPKWTKLESLKKAQGRQLTWTTRIATSSIPAVTLNRIFNNQINKKNPDARLKVIRFYIHSERYKDATDEISAVLAAFPKLSNREKLKLLITDIKQLQARRALAEIENRRRVGQHRLAYNLLKKFPIADAAVANTIKIQINKEIEKYDKAYAGIEKAKRDFKKLLASIDDSVFRDAVKPIQDEIFAEIDYNTYSRMADFRLFVDDKKLNAKQKIALAISGWVLGSNQGITKERTALGLYKVRNLVREYLLSETIPQRQRLLSELTKHDEANNTNVAMILAQMKPPVTTPVQPKLDHGTYQITIPASMQGQAGVSYFIHLPPEYNPYRKYPTLVTLHGAGNSPGQQLEWWAGAAHKKFKMRLGQATRNGYIVIVPDWTIKGQREAEFSFREHKAVLFSLRDACRRFSINTDKVFLTGHSMGGDLAWDIALSHPDLWAGVIPISAKCKKSSKIKKSNIKLSYRNAKYVPMYFVTGELDGKKTILNADNAWNKYYNMGYNTTVVEYIGRGHEHYHDEVVRVFQWMDRQERNFFPTQFKSYSFRQMDNFFWWVELDQMPLNRKIEVKAACHPLKKGFKKQNVNVYTNAKKITIWLSPQMVDFNRPINIVSNLKGFSRPVVEPKLSVMLEDARSRADRQHPFWAKVVLPVSRTNAAGRRAKPNR